MLHIALADADHAVRTYTRVVLADAGFRVSVASTASEALEILAGSRGGPVDVFVTDDVLRVGSGLDAYEEAVSSDWTRNTGLIICSSNDLAAAEAELRGLTVSAQVTRPCTPEVLIAAVEAAVSASASR